MTTGSRDVRRGFRAKAIAKVLLTTTMLTAATIAAQAQGSGSEQDGQAQPGRSQSGRSYDIPAGLLAQTLNRFVDASGLQLVYDASTTRALNSGGLRGSFSTQEALSRLLAGTGLTYRFTGPRTVTIEQTAWSQTVSGDTVVLDPVVVEGQRGSAWGPAGYVPSRSGAGTKTDVPLREIPQSVSVVSRPQMEARGAQSLSDAIGYSAGISASPYGYDTRYDQFVIRGFDETLLGTYRDGLRQPVIGFTGARTEPYGVERIDILRGPSSLLFGLNNPGGLINIISKKPPETPFGEVVASYGSHQRKQFAFDIGGPAVKDGSLLFRMTGLVRGSDTQVDFVKDDRYFFAPSLTFKPTDATTLTVQAMFQHDKAGDSFQLLPAEGTLYRSRFGKIPAKRFLGEPDASHFNVTQKSVGYQFEHKFDSEWTFRQNMRFSRFDTDYFTVYPTGLAGTSPMSLARTASQSNERLAVFGIDNQIQYNKDFGRIKNQLLAGLDYSRVSFHGTTYGGPTAAYLTPGWPFAPVTPLVGPINPYAPVYGSTIRNLPVTLTKDVEQIQTGIYLQDQIKLDDRWLLTLNGRYDWVETNSNSIVPPLAAVSNVLNAFRIPNAVTSQFRSNGDDQAFSGRVGLSYLFDNGLTPYVSYSTSFNAAPYFTQTSRSMTIPGLGAVPTSYAITPVKPEKGEQYEVGVKYQPNGSKSYILVSAYNLKKRDALSFDYSDPLQMSYYQTGAVRNRGIDIEGLYDFENGLRVLGAFSFIDSEVTKDNPTSGLPSTVGKRPERVPMHTASGWVDYTFQTGALRGLGLGAGLRFIGNTYGDRYNLIRVPSFTVVDAAIRYEYQNWRVSVTAKNLFDRDYVGTCSNIGGIIAGAPGSYVSCAYGERRRVDLAVAYRW